MIVDALSKETILRSDYLLVVKEFVDGVIVSHNELPFFDAMSDIS
jgi:hypothetical protein